MNWEFLGYFTNAWEVIGNANVLLEVGVWVVIGIIALIVLPFIMSMPFVRIIMRLWEKYIVPNRDDFMELLETAKSYYLDGELTADEAHAFKGIIVAKYCKITGRPEPGVFVMAILNHITTQIMYIAADFQKNSQVLEQEVATSPAPDPVLVEKIQHASASADGGLRLQSLTESSSWKTGIVSAIAIWIAKQVITILIDAVLPSLKDRLSQIRTDMATQTQKSNSN